MTRRSCRELARWALAIGTLMGAAALRADAPIPPRSLVDVSDYPPYYDALSAELRRAGLGGSDTTAGLSVIVAGVRVMPVRVVVAARLPEIAALLHGMASFPFATRVDHISLEPTLYGDRPFQAELMLLSPIRPKGDDPVSAALVSRVESDKEHDRALRELLSSLAEATDGGRLLRGFRVESSDVTIETALPSSTKEGRSADALMARVRNARRFLVSEVIGPQADPRTGEPVFVSIGLLDYPSRPPASESPAPTEAPGSDEPR